MNNLLKDLRYAIRSLRKRPSFTLVAVLTLALGIGINTTVFSLANSVFLRQLPVRDPHNLVWVFSNNEAPNSYPDYVEYRNETEIFDGLLAYDWVPLNLGANGQAERVQGALVSGNYFDVLGIQAQLGRTISSGDDETQAGAPVAVISDALWQRQFNKDGNVVGKSLVLNGHTFTVIGVAPNGFVGTEEAFPREIWIPLSMETVVRPAAANSRNNATVLSNRSARTLTVMGRLKSGVTVREAQARMNVVAARLAQNLSRFKSELSALRLYSGEWSACFSHDAQTRDRNIAWRGRIGPANRLRKRCESFAGPRRETAQRSCYSIDARSNSTSFDSSVAY